MVSHAGSLRAEWSGDDAHFLDLVRGLAEAAGACAELPPAEAIALLGEHLARAEGLDAADRAIATFAVALSLRPGKLEREALAPLRAAGLDERALHDVVQVACCFAYMNRLADGSGVGLLPHQHALARELFGEEALQAHLRWAEPE